MIAIDDTNEHLTLAGETFDTEELPTVNAIQPECRGCIVGRWDLFVERIDMTATLPDLDYHWIRPDPVAQIGGWLAVRRRFGNNSSVPSNDTLGGIYISNRFPVTSADRFLNFTGGYPAAGGSRLNSFQNSPIPVDLEPGLYYIGGAIAPQSGAEEGYAPEFTQASRPVLIVTTVRLTRRRLGGTHRQPGS